MSEQSKGVTAPRIAIKFGTATSSSSTSKTAPKSKQQASVPSSTLGKRPRPGAWGGGSDSEGEDDHGRHETITGFGADGAETERKSKDARTEKKEFVIAKQANRDWRAEVKAQRYKGKNLLPEEARAQKEGRVVETEPADQDKGLKWGLTLREKVDDDLEKDGEMGTSGSKVDTETKESSPSSPPKPKQSADEEALQALLGNTPKEERTIIASEEDALKRDLERAGEASTLADYEAMPVEEFGAALLRGMGWDGKERGTKVKEVKRRPARLGLGAKELKDAEELGGWNQGGGKKKDRPRLNEYRREEMKRKESRRSDDSYKRERERERESDRHQDRDRPRDRDHDYDRHRDRHRSHHDRDRRR